MDNTTAVISRPKTISSDLVVGCWRQRLHALPASAARVQMPINESKTQSKTVMGGYVADDFGTPRGPRPDRPPV